ncbi:hypothetical protein [Kushneria phosphatilytica]|uniref:Uncharacterized protein n=1 Tax=Kushneria phosphatilytica TaxID=657387 RepID=A0A1S1NZG5_9GAMM|nr:hypothetical protein [Kushneria phosphatilytica]OHV13061.1 hypothetical protein BH688_03435 [Kushneria phosphatilytica]QEL10934.1 hypothetical protein FY550_07190 [Kushneria phosphatilytica]
MSDAAILEIVELADGEVVLRPSQGNEEPLVAIRFSSEVLDMLRCSRFEVAREMLDHVISRTTLWEGDEAEEESERPSVVH